MGVREVCGTCKFNRYDRDSGDFYCGNDRSENEGASTFYDDRCDEWEEKE